MNKGNVGQKKKSTKHIALAVLAVGVLVFVAHKNSSSGPSFSSRCKTQVASMDGKHNFQTQAYNCPMKHNVEENFSSQDAEDRQIFKMFNGMCGGTYIEMGAMNGKTFSNTWVLNKELDWKGVLIEANPTSAAKLSQNRPNELATVNAAVCDVHQKLHFMDDKQGGSTSGFWEFTSDGFKKTWWKSQDIEDTIEVDCYPMDFLLNKHVPDVTFFDVYSLDVEGSELKVLHSIDFNRVGFGVLVIETQFFSKKEKEEIVELMFNNGYVLYNKLLSEVPHEDGGPNDWFINKDFYTVYAHLLTPIII